jgi:hypothetical protein
MNQDLPRCPPRDSAVRKRTGTCRAAWFIRTGRGEEYGIPADVIADGIVLLKVEVNGQTVWFILDNGAPGMTVVPLSR